MQDIQGKDNCFLLVPVLPRHMITVVIVELIKAWQIIKKYPSYIQGQISTYVIHYPETYFAENLQSKVTQHPKRNNEQKKSF